MERKVGKIKNLKINQEDDSLEVTIKIEDPKFKKELLRNLDLSGKLKFEEDTLIFVQEE